MSLLYVPLTVCAYVIRFVKFCTNVILFLVLNGLFVQSRIYHLYLVCALVTFESGVEVIVVLIMASDCH